MTDGDATPYTRWMRESTRTWVRATEHFTNGVFEANRAILAAYGIDGAGSVSGAESGRASVGPAWNGTGEQSEPSASELAGEETSGWTVERDIAETETISVGDSVRFSKRVDGGDVAAFARASGDTNPLHLDDGFAERTRFGRRIAHGTLVSGLISAALARLPGLTIYVSQTTQFLRPADIDQRLTAVVTVEEDLGDDRYRLSTDVFDEEDQALVEGEAVVLVDPRPE